MEEVDGICEDKQENDEITREAKEERPEVVSVPSFQCLYEDGSYIENQNEYYADHFFLDDWLQDDSTYSNDIDHFCYDDAAADGEECRKERGEESNIDSETPAKERKEKVSDAPFTTTPEIRDATDEKENSSRGKKHPQKRQRRQEGPKEKQKDEETQYGTQQDGEQEQELSHLRRESRKRLRLEQRQKRQLEKDAERLKRQQQKLEEKTRRAEQREHEREERKRAQRHDQQIRLYFAGADTALLVALEQLLQQPQFLQLKDIVVLIDETARQTQQHKISRAVPSLSAAHLSCTTQAKTADIVSDESSLPTISAEVLDEEFTAVEVLARLCPAGLCVVCMPHPIQNHLQLLQSELLLADQLVTQSVSVPTQMSRNTQVQPCVSEDVESVSIGNSQERKQQLSQIHFQCDRSCGAVEHNSSTGGTGRSSPDRTRRNRIADCGSRCPEKSRHLLGVYARFLVLPLFTERLYSQSRETHAHDTHSCASSSQPLCGNSSSRRDSGGQCPDEPLSENDNHFIPRSVVCTADCAYRYRFTSSDSVSHFNAPGSCNGHTNSGGRTITKLNALKRKNSRSFLLCLPGQLSKLQEELQGVARVVCIFQGVRASLAVPQPRVEDEREAADTSEERCFSIGIHVDGHRGGCCRRYDCSSASHEPICSGSTSVCSRSSSPVAGCCQFELLTHSQCTLSAAQEGELGERTEVGQDVSRKNLSHLQVEQQLPSPKADTHETTTARGEGERIQKLNIDEGMHTQAEKAISVEDSTTPSPGELDETIATLVIDCSIDCVEPPDATATADYILTAAKHMRAAHRTLGEQHLRVKKSKNFTAAEEAILAEVAHAATSIADGTCLHRPDEAAAIVYQSVTDLHAAPKVTSAITEAATQATAGITDVTPIVSPPAGTIPDTATAKQIRVYPSTQQIVPTMWNTQSDTARKKLSGENVFVEYEDVFSFACRLWGKQLMQIPTVTEKVAAAVMRQFKRPAALLRRLRIAEADEDRGRAERPASDAAKLANDGNVRSVSHSASVSKKRTEATALGGAQDAVKHLLPHTGSRAQRNGKDEAPARADGKSKSARQRKSDRKGTVSGVERLVEELADSALYAIPNSATQTIPLQTEKDPFQGVESASKGAGRTAKIGLARARKVCLLFSQRAQAEL